MATVQVSTLARARNINDISIKAPWRCALALGVALSFPFPAFADTITNRIYPSDPTTWSLTGGAVLSTSQTVIAPDGRTTAPIQGASGMMSGVMARNAVPVGAGEVDTVSVYYRLVAGVHPIAHLCINGVIVGQANNQCMTFNANTGMYSANDPGIIDYTIAPVGPNGWFRVSIVFKTTVGGMAVPTSDGNNGALFAVWGAQFETGPYPGQLIPTTSMPMSGQNQILPNPDSLTSFIVRFLDLNPRLQTGRGFSRFFVHGLTP